MLCNEANLHHRDSGWTWHGDAVDVAFLALGRKLGQSREAALETYPLINEIPFEPEHRFAATFHRDAAQTRIAVKGSPERVLSMCAADDEDRQRWLQAADQLAAAGYRGDISCEVSGMVWSRADYDAIAAARTCYQNLAPAFERAGIERG